MYRPHSWLGAALLACGLAVIAALPASAFGQTLRRGSMRPPPQPLRPPSATVMTPFPHVFPHMHHFHPFVPFRFGLVVPGFSFPWRYGFSTPGYGYSGMMYGYSPRMYGYSGMMYGSGYGGSMYGSGYGGSMYGSPASPSYSVNPYAAYAASSSGNDTYAVKGQKQSTQAAEAQPARVEVWLPDANATVRVDGNKMTSTGTTREFVSPTLQPGQERSYRISATWTQDGQPRSAEVVVRGRAGRTAVVDFTQQPPSTTVRPAAERLP